MSRRARITVLLAFLPLLALAGWGLLRFAGSERGAAWMLAALERLAPGIEVRGFEGTALSARAAGIAWTDGDTRVELQQVAWELRPACLLARTLCLGRFGAATLRVSVSPSSPDEPPFSMAPFALPLPLSVDEARIGRLRIDEGGRELLAIEDIGFEAEMHGSRIDATRLAGRLPGAAVSLSGYVELRGQLQMDVAARIEPGADWPALQLGAEGDLARLALQARTLGEPLLEASGHLEPLGDRVPFELALRAVAALAAPGELAALGTLDGAEATLRGTLDRVQGSATARTASAWIGANALAASAEWQPGALRLQTATLEGEIGRVQAAGDVALDGAQGWQLALQLEDACLPRWRAEPGCRIGGRVQATGSLAGEADRVRAELALDGEINGLPAAATGVLRLDAAGTVHAEALELASASNRLRLQGSAGDTLALDGELALANLADTLPQAGGNGGGTLRLAGTREAPRVALALALQDLAWRGSRATALRIEGAWEGREAQNRLSVTGSGLEIAGLRMQSLDAELAGSAAAHRLRLQAPTEAATLELACTGGLRSSGNWSGGCADLGIAPRSGESWRLARPIALARDAAGGTLSVEPFCLQRDRASLCSEGRVRVAPGRFDGVALRAARLPASLLAGWLPEALGAEGELAFSLDASRAEEQPPRLTARLHSDAIALQPQAAGEALPVELRDLEAALQLRDGGARVLASARTGAEGTLVGGLSMPATAPGAALEGSLTLQAIDVAPFLRSLPGSLDAGGHLDGRITVGGTVAAPALSGELAVEGGHFSHEALPQSIDAFALALRFAGPEATLDGRFRTAAGEGTLGGTLGWAGEDWSAALRLQADELLLEPLRGSRITVRPDLRVTLDPRRAAIEGEVRIPRAAVEIATLPESAVGVSPDTVIVGQPRPQPRFDYSLAVALRLGEDVRFKGFGADARLGGEVTLTRAPGAALEARGEVKILEGRYRAYGQRLEVTEGRLMFRGAPDRPGLRITAVRRIEEEPVTVGVQVRGNAKAPELSVFSKPAMPENRALHYLLTGRAPADDTSDELALSGAMMQLGIAGASQVTGGLLGKLGIISDFQIDSRKVEGGTEYQLSGYLTPDLYLRYGVSTFEKINTFRLRYRLTPSIFVEAVSGYENAVDFLYSFER